MNNYLFSKSRKLNQLQWAQTVEEFRSSPLSQSEFCRIRGISRCALRYWIDRYPIDPHDTKTPPGAELPNGVELVEIDASIYSHDEPFVEIETERFIVRFFEQADPAVVQTVIRELGL